MNVCVPVNRQGHEIFLNIFDILDLENVRIDTKINFVSCLQPEIWKLGYAKGYLDPENIPTRNIFKKFGREGKNPGGWFPPPWAFSVSEIPWASDG